MSNGLIIKSSPSDFCDFLDGKCGDIGGLLEGKLQSLEQTAMCLAMAVINKMCSNGTSPAQPLHNSIQTLMSGMSRMSVQLTDLLFIQGDRAMPMPELTQPLMDAANSVIMQGIAEINAAAMQITGFMNTVKGIADSVISAFTSVLELGPIGLVCLIPLLEKVQNIAWLLDMFSGFDDFIDVDATKLLYGFTEMMIKQLLGFLLPDLMGCSL